MVLAVAVDPGWSSLLWVLALFAVSEPLMGQVVEPMVFGHSTGLSPVAVIGAAAFWTWLWGSIGLLLAVPLTVCLVVLGRHVEQLEFLEVMLGDQPALDPEEIFYQRALAGDADALADQAEACLRAQRLPEYLDNVALPALALAQADAGHGTLTPERRERMEGSVVTLLEDLEEADEAVAAKAAKAAAKDAAKATRRSGTRRPRARRARQRGGGRGGGAAAIRPGGVAGARRAALPARARPLRLAARHHGGAGARPARLRRAGRRPGDDARRAAAAAVPLLGGGRGERGQPPATCCAAPAGNNPGWR